jgi:hypothetical protein
LEQPIFLAKKFEGLTNGDNVANPLQASFEEGISLM